MTTIHQLRGPLHQLILTLFGLGLRTLLQLSIVRSAGWVDEHNGSNWQWSWHLNCILQRSAKLHFRSILRKEGRSLRCHVGHALLFQEPPWKMKKIPLHLCSADLRRSSEESNQNLPLRGACVPEICYNLIAQGCQGIRCQLWRSAQAVEYMHHGLQIHAGYLVMYFCAASLHHHLVALNRHSSIAVDAVAQRMT